MGPEIELMGKILTALSLGHQAEVVGFFLDKNQNVIRHL